ncbi:hypothetical protein [Clostridium butyricum]|uniref:hypothetical protein n=1 Tax=Clostridium butyricum TaxID=1492 RepID=UPI0012B6E066|nr:hypothetical protein [Clostridium butyricum]
MVYNISYDLHDPGQKYQKLHDLIVKVSNNRWSHALESTYIIKSDKTPEQIYNVLSRALDSNDDILIAEITPNYYGCLDKQHWPYIKGLF